MVQGFIELGLSDSVANCVVGWSDRLELAPVDPSGERDASEQLLIEEAIESCTVADALVNPPEQEPERLAFDDQPYTFGDDLDLDVLWTQCELGDGRACDDLWEQAPVGSEYESFGVTCGQRLDLLNCAEELNDAVVD